MEVVVKEIKSHVITITLNNPEKGNVVNNDNLFLLKKFVDEANNDDDIRVIVIRGRDGVFSRGMDFKNMLSHSNEITEDFSRPYLDTVMAIRNSKKPVIAAVDGDVLAGGMGIMLACDIVIATRRSSFGLSEVIFGLIPALVFPLLLERLSLKRARSMVISSKRVTTEDAVNIGLIDEVVEDDKLDKKLVEYFQRLLFSSPEALSLVKEYTDRITDNKIQEKMEEANRQLTELLQQEKNLDAIRSFLDGEKLSWSTRYKRK